MGIAIATTNCRHKMRILHTTDSLDPDTGGPARSVPQLALAQADLGHDVGLWCPGKAYASIPDIHSGKSKKLQLLSGHLGSVIREFGHPEIMHDHGIWRPYHKWVAAHSRRLGTPLIVSPRGMLEPWALSHKKAKKKAAWSLYQARQLRAVSALHATAITEARQLRKLGLEAPLLLVPNGVTIPELKLIDQRQDDEKTALFLGRIHPVKGLPLLIEAWRKVKPEGWKMRVIGPPQDGHDAVLKSQVKAAELSDDWAFEPSLEGDEKWKALLEADLLILPSHSENFGIVVAEALACGTPVITTTGTPWQELTGRRCGWWVDPTVDALASSLKDATSTSAAERDEMGKIGREWMAQDFTWPAIAAKTIDFYESLIKSQNPAL